MAVIGQQIVIWMVFGVSGIPLWISAMDLVR